MNVLELVEELSTTDIEVWRAGERLLYQGPEDVVTPEILGKLKQHKAELLQLLSEHPALPDVYPLSHGQKALWMFYQEMPENPAYNAGFAVQITSALNIRMLQKALQTLIDRHPVLRTTFRFLNDAPRQVAPRGQEVCFEQKGAPTWKNDDIRSQIQDIHTQPFDLEHGPIFRATLLTRQDREHFLILDIHHIVADGWSLWLLIDELFRLYKVYLKNTAVDLPPMPWQYQDFVSWQADMLKSTQGEQLWQYWRRQLSGELPVLNLPADHPYPTRSSFQGDSYSFTLPDALTRHVKTLAQTTGTTLYMVLLAAFQVLLHRYSGQDDIIIGSPVTGRSQQDFRSVVGYFSNMIALRANLSKNLSFREFLKQVRQTVLDALAHQDFPFPLLVQRVNPPRDPSRSPIFQAVFAVQKPQSSVTFSTRLHSSGEQHRMHLGGLSLIPLELRQYEGIFELMLEVFDLGSSLAVTFKYQTDLFEERTIARMSDHFTMLLGSIVSYPEQPISELPFLTDAEWQQVVVGWNATSTDYPSERCIHELFEEHADRTPNAIAVECENIQLTYQELNRRANQVACYLRENGVKPDVLAGICMERSLEMLVGILGILKAGGAYIPLDPASPLKRVRRIISDSQVTIVVSQEKLSRNLVRSAVSVICLDSDWETISQTTQENLKCGVTPKNLAYVLYTSGSTGTPKGVMLEHRNVIGFLDGFEQIAPSSPSLIGTSVCSFGFDVSVWEFFSNLCFGGTVHLLTSEILVSPEQFARYIETHHITSVYIPPAILPYVIEQIEQVRGSLALNRVLVGVEPIPQGLLQRLRRRCPQLHILNGYGPTETTICAAVYPFQQAREPEQRTPIGTPLPGYHIYIVDPSLQPIPIGVPGELLIGGIGTGRGYLNQAALTAARFVPHRFCKTPGVRLYKTGDLARCLPDGNIEFLGRIDHQIKIRGFRVELGEIETVLTQHPAVRETVVIVREDRPGEKRLIAYLIPDQAEPPSVSDLRNILKQSLPDYMIPASFEILEEFPLTPNGKIDRRALPAPQGLRPELDALYVQPRTETEQRIAVVWQDLLQVKQVGIHDNFFDVGGHSLLAVQMHQQLQKALEHEFSLVELFHYPTIAAFARHLEAKLQAQKDFSPPQEQETKYQKRKNSIKHLQQFRKTRRIHHETDETHEK